MTELVLITGYYERRASHEIATAMGMIKHRKSSHFNEYFWSIYSNSTTSTPQVESFPLIHSMLNNTHSLLQPKKAIGSWSICHPCVQIAVLGGDIGERPCKLRWIFISSQALHHQIACKRTL